MPRWTRELLVWCLVTVVLWNFTGCRTTETGTGDNPVMTAILNLLPKSHADQRATMVEKLGSDDADIRREGLKMLAVEEESADWTTTLELLALMAETDPEPQVRATAVEVFAQLDNQPELAETYRIATRDESVWVRRANVKVLSRRQDHQALKLLLEILRKDPDASIRTETARVIGEFPTRQSIQGLIRALAEDDEFGVWYRAKESLIRITGQDFRYNHHTWQQWFNTTDNPFPDK